MPQGRAPSHRTLRRVHSEHDLFRLRGVVLLSADTSMGICWKQHFRANDGNGKWLLKLLAQRWRSRPTKSLGLPLAFPRKGRRLFVIAHGQGPDQTIVACLRRVLVAFPSPQLVSRLGAASLSCHWIRKASRWFCAYTSDVGLLRRLTLKQLLCGDLTTPCFLEVANINRPFEDWKFPSAAHSGQDFAEINGVYCVQPICLFA